MSVIDAVLDRLAAVVDPTYDGHVPLLPDGRPVTQRYAVLYAAPGSRESDDLAHTASSYGFSWQVTSVGEDRRQAEWVAVRCRDALLDERLVSDGWQVGVVEHDRSEVIRQDPDLPGTPLFYAVDTYSAFATR